MLSYSENVLLAAVSSDDDDDGKECGEIQHLNCFR